MMLGGTLETSARSRMMFWGAVALPGLVVFATGLLWIPSPFFEQWHLTGLDPRVGASSGTFIVALAGAACIGWAGEWLRTTVRAGRALGPLARAACGLAAAVIAGTLVYSLLRPLPGLATVEVGPPPDAQTYVWWVLSPIATFARLRWIDFLTWASFWGAYGWAGVVLPWFVIVVLTALVSLAAIRSLVATGSSDRDAVGTRRHRRRVRRHCDQQLWPPPQRARPLLDWSVPPGTCTAGGSGADAIAGAALEWRARGRPSRACSSRSWVCDAVLARELLRVGRDDLHRTVVIRSSPAAVSLEKRVCRMPSGPAEIAIDGLPARMTTR